MFLPLNEFAATVFFIKICKNWKYFLKEKLFHPHLVYTYLFLKAKFSLGRRTIHSENSCEQPQFVFGFSSGKCMFFRLIFSNFGQKIFEGTKRIFFQYCFSVCLFVSLCLCLSGSLCLSVWLSVSHLEIGPRGVWCMLSMQLFH